MSDDPLAKWRRPGAQEVPTDASRASLPNAQNSEYAYAAFRLLEKGIGEFLSIERADGMVRRFSYNGLVEIADDGEKGTQIALVFNFGPVVFLYGRNLAQLALGLCFRRIESITEFTSKLWPKPERSDPVVEKIDIHQSQ